MILLCNLIIKMCFFLFYKRSIEKGNVSFLKENSKETKIIFIVKNV